MSRWTAPRNRMHWLAVLLGACVATVGHASEQDVMNNLFDMYTNATPAGVYETQQRHVLSGGSFVARARVEPARIFNITPPSIEAGCSGIDIYGGSFSFINRDEFNDLLRSIGQNAIGYTFSLALDAMCGNCMNQLKTLAANINEQNGKLKDSCYMAKSLVDKSGLGGTVTSTFGQIHSAIFGSNQGGTNDAIAPVVDRSTERQVDQNVGQEAPKLINVVWKALEDEGVVGWFSRSGDDDFQEFLMSLTGTVIRRDVDSTGGDCTNSAGDPEYCFVPVEPTVSFKDIYHGVVNGDVRVLRCQAIGGHGADECLAVEPQTVQNFEGMRQRVQNLLVGGGGHVGLVEKMVSRNDTLDAAEMSFIQTAPLPVMTMLKGLMGYPAAARAYALKMSGPLALDMTNELIHTMWRAVRDAVSNYSGEPEGSIKLSESMIAKMDSIQQEYYDEANNLEVESGALYKLMQEFLVLRQSQMEAQRREPISTSASTDDRG